MGCAFLSAIGTEPRVGLLLEVVNYSLTWQSKRRGWDAPVVDGFREISVPGGLWRDISVVSAYLEIPQCSRSWSSENG